MITCFHNQIPFVQEFNDTFLNFRDPKISLFIFTLSLPYFLPGNTKKLMFRKKYKMSETRDAVFYLKTTAFVTTIGFVLPLVLAASNVSLTTAASLSIILIVWIGYLGGVILLKLCRLLPALLIQLITGLTFRALAYPQIAMRVSQNSTTSFEEFNDSFSSTSTIARYSKFLNV